MQKRVHSSVRYAMNQDKSILYPVLQVPPPPSWTLCSECMLQRFDWLNVQAIVLKCSYLRRVKVLAFEEKISE